MSNLFLKLRHHLASADHTLDQIIDYQEWRNLGHDTLHEAWAANMAGVQINGVQRAKIILAMYEEGTTFEQAAEAIHGVGYQTARLFFNAYINQLDPEAAVEYVNRSIYEGQQGEGIFVRGHFRKRPEKRNGLTMVGFDDEELKEWRAIAAENKMTLAEWAKEVLRQAAILPAADNEDQALISA